MSVNTISTGALDVCEYVEETLDDLLHEKPTKWYETEQDVWYAAIKVLRCAYKFSASIDGDDDEPDEDAEYDLHNAAQEYESKVLYHAGFVSNTDDYYGFVGK